MKLIIKLPSNRLNYGSLNIYDDEAKYVRGPFRCLGRADSTLAAAAGNVNRDPLKPMGDTPLGNFNGSVVAAGVGSGALRSYGPNKRILLTPPPKGRAGLMVHGGAPSNTGGLRPTEGCVRVSNEDMAKILEVVPETETCNVEIIDGSGSL